MNVSNFSASQRQALLDLLVLAMYMDGNLAAAEEARVEQLLAKLGVESDYDRNRDFDAAVTRVRQHSQSADDARACVGRLARSFTTSEQRRRVYDALSDLTALDGQVSAEEGKFLTFVRAAFQM